MSFGPAVRTTESLKNGKECPPSYKHSLYVAFALKLHTLAVSGGLLATINGHRGSLVLIVDLHALRLTGFLEHVCVCACTYAHVCRAKGEIWTVFI